MKQWITIKRMLLLFALTCSSMLNAQIVVEAENFTSKVGDAVVENGISIGYFGEAGESLTYTINVTQTGFYEIALLYASGVDGSVCIQNAQGEVGYINFSSTVDWTNWTSTINSPIIYLNAGSQSFIVKGNGSDLNINSFTLSKSTITDTAIAGIEVNPANASILPNASVQFVAYAKTANGKAIASKVIWSRNALNGLFSAGVNEGLESITISIGSLSKTVPVRISMPQKMRNYVVSEFGNLSVKESSSGASDWAVRGEDGTKASLTGPSFFWSGSAETWWTKETVDWLVDDWHIQVIRCPASIAPDYYKNSAPFGSYSPIRMGTTWNANDYYHNPELVKKMMDEMVTAAIENDIYVIIDFHEHHAQFWKQEAIEFFDYFSKKWGAYPNVLYEIFNEPFVNDQVNQDGYADAVCQTIRANDPDNIIIIGSKNYSRDPDYGASFYKYGNIAGTWHGYVENNHQADWSGNSHWNNGTGVVVTEWGRDSNSDGGLVNIFKNAGVIHCPWSINNKQVNGDEKWSALNSTCTKISGWTDQDLSTNGKWMKDMTLSYGYNPPPKEDLNKVELTVGAEQILHMPTTSTKLLAFATSGIGVVNITWSQIAGPNTANFSANDVAEPIVSNLQLGKYIFKVSATNGMDLQEKEVIVSVVTEHYKIPVGGELIDNVSDNNITTLWGGTWDVFDDSRDLGASTITEANNLPVNEAIKAEYNLNQGSWKYDPYCGVEVSLQKDKEAFDVSECEKITYKYKGSAHDFRAEMSIVSDYDYHKIEIPASANWTSVTINWSDLAQDPTWGTDVGVINKADIAMFSWQVSAASGSGTIEIDDLTCVGAKGPVGGNMPPVVYAGEDFTVANASASLNGSQSFDIDGDALTFEWSQLFGPATVTIASPNDAKTDISDLQTGTYTFVLLASDGLLSNTDTVEINVTQEIQTATLVLEAGWNLISLNIVPTNASVSATFPNALLVKSNIGFYKSGQPEYLNSLKEIKEGEGYLVYNSIDETVTIQGATSSRTLNNLITGWNLIGIPTQTNYSVINLPSETQIVKDFDGFYAPNYGMSTLTELKVGKAYFIKVSGDCEIIWK